MTLEFLAALVAGVFGAGVGMILRWLAGARLPRWIVPVMAGVGMIGFTVYSEYNWYPRLQAGLPAGVVIAQPLSAQVALRPWTFVVPLINRAIVVDKRQSLRNPNAPDLVLTRVMFFGRWQTTTDIMSTFDCANNRRVDVTAGISFDDTGNLQGGEWVDLAADDPVLQSACHGG
ncbi:MAG: hypothetical protein Q7J57_06355 [Gemmobacter sp.]|nr:hypothetical protein [Gemmobacter sp.]